MHAESDDEEGDAQQPSHLQVAAEADSDDEKGVEKKGNEQEEKEGEGDEEEGNEEDELPLAAAAGDGVPERMFPVGQRKRAATHLDSLV